MSLFGRDVSVIVVLSILALPFAGAYLGGAGGAASVSVAVTMIAEFGAMVGAVVSNLQAVVAQVGTGPSVVAMSAAVLIAEKIVH